MYIYFEEALEPQHSRIVEDIFSSCAFLAKEV
jgi:hypothetical protein